MAGQIVKKSENTWLIRIFQGRDAQGKRRYYNKTIHGTKKDAQKWLTAALRDRDIGIFIEPSRETLNEYLDRWLKTAAKPRLREHTFRSYKEWLERYIREPLGDRRMGELRAPCIQAVYAAMLERGLQPRTIQYTHSILTSALKQAVKWGIIARNPCDLVELPRRKRNEMKAFSPAEAARFLTAAAEDKHGIVFAFALATGMRVSEYLALQWKDIDLQKGAATVQRALVWKSGGGWYFAEPKTPKSRRTVPLPPSLVGQLAAHRRAQAEHRLKLGCRYENHDLVFATDKGTPIYHRHLFRRHFLKVLERAGLNGYRVYDLRHSCATLLLATGENPKVVSERLGHSSIVMTLDIYSHVLPDMQQAATEKLEALLFRQASTR
jgi:integrase